VGIKRERVTPNWEGIISTLEENLEDVLGTLDQQKHEGVRADVRVLEAFDTLDRFMKAIHQDLGV
jgi:hypothetical protein